MENFDFAAPADVYISDRGYRRHPLRYLRFERSADAIRHVMECENADAVVVVETDDHRAGRAGIRQMYLSAEYPLQRHPAERSRT